MDRHGCSNTIGFGWLLRHDAFFIFAIMMSLFGRVVSHNVVEVAEVVLHQTFPSFGKDLGVFHSFLKENSK